MSRQNKPLWTCPRCHRQFANRNQAHSCTDVTVADCFRGRNPNLVDVFHAFEAAVRSCGEVRVHPTPSRIAFIARMTFTGAAFKQKGLEIGVMLPYRSHDPRFHKFFPSGNGGVHYLMASKVSHIDAQLRKWIAEAYRVGMQEYLGRPVRLKPTKVAAEKPAVKTSRANGRTCKIFYIHWHRDELEERSAPLRKAGHEVRGHWDVSNVAKLVDYLPDVFVISLDRLPSHGRSHAGWFWEAKKRQTIPIVFAGGQPDKVQVARNQFPQALFCTTDEVPDVIGGLIPLNS